MVTLSSVGVPVLDAQVVVFDVGRSRKGKINLSLIIVPDDPGHLVAVQVGYRISDFDLGHTVGGLRRKTGVARL